MLPLHHIMSVVCINVSKILLNLLSYCTDTSGSSPAYDFWLLCLAVVLAGTRDCVYASTSCGGKRTASLLSGVKGLPVQGRGGSPGQSTPHHGNLLRDRSAANPSLSILDLARLYMPLQETRTPKAASVLPDVQHLPCQMIP